MDYISTGIHTVTWTFCNKPYASIGSLGHEKDAWPELLHATLNYALLTVKNSELVENVYVQAPSSGMPATIQGTTKDVWLYVDGDGGAIYEIPKRGMWHPNRMYI